MKLRITIFIRKLYIFFLNHQRMRYRYRHEESEKKIKLKDKHLLDRISQTRFPDNVSKICEKSQSDSLRAIKIVVHTLHFAIHTYNEKVTFLGIPGMYLTRFLDINTTWLIVNVKKDDFLLDYWRMTSLGNVIVYNEWLLSHWLERFMKKRPCNLFLFVCFVSAN